MQAPRKLVSFCLVGLTAAALGAGCSDGGGTTPLGGNTAGTGSPPAGTAGTGGSPAGGSGTTAGTGGTGSPTAGTGGTGSPTAGTGGTGSPTAGTGGVAAGGGGAGGGGGTTAGTGGTTGGTAGTATGGGGTGGGDALGFPAGCPAPTGTHSATALTRTCFNTNASDCAATDMNMNPAKQAIDDSTMTRFSTGVKQDQVGTHFTWEVDLGAAVMIDGITATSNATDFAPGLMVSVSPDGTTFTNVACTPTGAMVTDVSFAATSAKVVRLTQYGNSDKWWSLYDFNIYGTGTTCGGGAGTPTDACTTKHTQ